eukprot:TRINITY_DN24329_c0_g1_i1.p1 TRINITY_DN24329_c0_g1~~TRINITY_DN24329_c0_g1_i1.p1  ORF type:complete len:626 (+),score=193.13 TRINITY_DN24329_c0_g1_i1:91-1968(+)
MATPAGAYLSPYPTLTDRYSCGAGAAAPAPHTPPPSQALTATRRSIPASPPAAAPLPCPIASPFSPEDSRRLLRPGSDALQRQRSRGAAAPAAPPPQRSAAAPSPPTTAATAPAAQAASAAEAGACAAAAAADSAQSRHWVVPPPDTSPPGGLGGASSPAAAARHDALAATARTSEDGTQRRAVDLLFGRPAPPPAAAEASPQLRAIDLLFGRPAAAPEEASRQGSVRREPSPQYLPRDPELLLPEPRALSPQRQPPSAWLLSDRAGLPGGSIECRDFVPALPDDSPRAFPPVAPTPQVYDKYGQAMAVIADAWRDGGAGPNTWREEAGCEALGALWEASGRGKGGRLAALQKVLGGAATTRRSRPETLQEAQGRCARLQEAMQRQRAQFRRERAAFIQGLLRCEYYAHPHTINAEYKSQWTPHPEEDAKLPQNGPVPTQTDRCDADLIDDAVSAVREGCARLHFRLENALGEQVQLCARLERDEVLAKEAEQREARLNDELLQLQLQFKNLKEEKDSLLEMRDELQKLISEHDAIRGQYLMEREKAMSANQRADWLKSQLDRLAKKNRSAWDRAKRQTKAKNAAQGLDAPLEPEHEKPEVMVFKDPWRPVGGPYRSLLPPDGSL